MSAFLVPVEHINSLVHYFKTRPYPDSVTRETEAQDLATLLYEANVESVNYRYDFAEAGNEPPIVYVAPKTRLTPIEAIKAIHCLDYQSCEPNDWDRSPAKQWLDRWLVQALSDYQSAHMERSMDSGLIGYHAAKAWPVYQEAA